MYNKPKATQGRERRMKLNWIVLCIVLTGCAVQPTYKWMHPTANQAQFDRDKAQCEYEIAAATQQTDYSYRSVFGQELDRATRKRDLGILCMKAKGYTQQAISAQQ